MPASIDNLPAAQLRALLTFSPQDLPETEAALLRDFLKRIGGRQNARLAAEMLGQLEQAEI